MKVKGVRGMPSLRILWSMALLASVVACGGGASGEAGTPLFGTDAGSGTSDTGDASAGGGITTVSSQVPTQKSMSISVETYALNWGNDGEETKITVRVADSAGNPVPEGSVVQFSVSGGQIQTACRMSGSAGGESNISGCSVTFATQNPRPAYGYVSVVAWMAGEEAYIDSNGNGRYDLGEPFKDMGRIYRDDDANASFTAGVDEINVGGTNDALLGVGDKSCATNQPAALAHVLAPSVTNTCDGVWGPGLVRGLVYLPLSSSQGLGIRPAGTRKVQVYSQYSVSRPEVAAPSGTTVAALGVPVNCTVAISPAAVPSTAVGPTIHDVVATGTGCTGNLSIEAKSGDITKVTVVAL
jgi:hypothetical protein